MRLFLILFTLFLAISCFSPPVMAETQWNVGLSVDKEGIRNFNLSIGKYYQGPEQEVIVVRERGFRDEELPVIFFLATRARVAPGIIIDLRRRGLSWLDITLHFGLGPEIYYVPVQDAKVGPPYGKAYGYYKKHPKHEWGKIALADDDVVNLVNLKFISEYHGYAPENVMKMRAEGKDFITIHEAVYKEGKYKQAKKYEEDDNFAKVKKGKGNGKDKSKGKGKK